MKLQLWFPTIGLQPAAVCVCVCLMMDYISSRATHTHIRKKLLELYKYLSSSSTTIFFPLFSTIFTNSLFFYFYFYFWRVLFSFSNFFFTVLCFYFGAVVEPGPSAFRVYHTLPRSCVYLEMLIDIRYVFRWPAQQLLEQQRP